MAVEHLTDRKELNELERVVVHHSRVRRFSLASPASDLHRTHRFVIPTATISANSFPSDIRTKSITFRTQINVSGVTNGLVFELGSSTNGVAIALDATKMYVAAGNGAGASNGGVLLTFDNAAAWPIGLNLEIAVSVRPGDGSIRLWLNGKIEGTTQSVDTTFTSNIWATEDDGSFVSVVAGTVNLDIPVGSRVAPSGFSAIAPLSVYARQIPKSFPLFV